MVAGLGVPLLRRQLSRPCIPMTTAPCSPGSSGSSGTCGGAGHGGMQAWPLGLWGGLCGQTAAGGWEGLAVGPAKLQGVDPGDSPPPTLCWIYPRSTLGLVPPLGPGATPVTIFSVPCLQEVSSLLSKHLLCARHLVLSCSLIPSSQQP